MISLKQPVFHMNNTFPYNLMFAITGEHIGSGRGSDAGALMIDPLFIELNKLSVDQRKVLILRFIDNYPRQMTASHLSIPIKEVVQLEQSALKSLRTPDRIKRFKGMLTTPYENMLEQYTKIEEENKALKCIIQDIQNGKIQPDDISWLKPVHQVETDDTEDSVLDKDVKNAGFTSRTLNALMRGGVPTLGQLVSMSEDELTALRNVGPGTIQDIHDTLSRHSLTLGQITKSLNRQRIVLKNRYLSRDMVYNRGIDKTIYIQQ